MVNKKTLKWNERCSISRSFYLLVYEKQEQTNWSVPVLAQKEGRELSLWLSHTTPLAVDFWTRNIFRIIIYVK